VWFKRLIADPDDRTAFFAAFAVGTLLRIFAAVYCSGFLNCDEHFQIIEFAASKIGLIDTAVLTWEYHNQARGWLPAGFAAVVMGGAQKLLSLADPHDLALALRVATAVLSSLLLAAGGLWWSTCLSYSRAKFFLWWGLQFFFWIPMLSVHPSSEALAAMFLFAALGGLQYLRACPVGRNGLVACVAVLAAIGFQWRYQIGLALLGAAIWCWVYRVVTWREQLLGVAVFALVTVLGSAVDAWGYGQIIFMPWVYLKVQLIEGRAAQFGVTPFWEYIRILLVQVPQPFGLIALILALLVPIFLPSSVGTFAAAFFMLGHCAIGHKELRFLYPLVPLFVLMLVQMYDLIGDHGIWSRPSVRLALSVLLLLNFAYLGEALAPRQPVIEVLRPLQTSAGEKAIPFWHGENPVEVCGNLRLNFYVPKNVVVLQANDLSPIPIEQSSWLRYERRRGVLDTPNSGGSDCTTLATAGPQFNLPANFLSNQRLQKFLETQHHQRLAVCSKK